MRLRQNIAIGMLLLLIAGAFLAIYYPTVPSREAPRAVRGELDLSGWNFEKRGLAVLDGEWGFYPGELVTPERFRQGSVPGPSYLKVPGTWRGTAENGQGMSRRGYGTYRLRLRLSPSDDIYGIKVTSIRMGHRLYIDGKLLGESGQPSEARATNKPGNTPYTAYFQPNGSEIEIVLQVSNYDFVTGGIVNSLQFGLSSDMTKLNSVQIGTDLAISLVLVILGAYHISVYVLGRKEKAYLLLGSYMLMLGLQMSIYGEKITQRMLPDLPFNLVYKALELFQFLGVVLIIRLFSIVENRLFKPRTRRWLELPFALYVASVVLLPYRVHIDYKYLFVMYESVAVLYLACRLIYLYARNPAETTERTERFLLLGGLLTLMIFLFGISLYGENMVPTDLVAKCALLGFILFMNLLLAVRVSNAYAKTEVLSKQLALSNQLKDEFLIHTSHELKTPLNGILNLISGLLEDEDRSLGARQKQSLWLVKDTASKLSMLIRDLIDVTHLRHGELRLYPTVVDVRVAVQIVLDMLAFELSGKQVRFENEVQAETWMLADENRLRQVLYNLVHNAIKHTERGSVIIKTSMDKDKVIIFVEDTGTGIEPEKRATLFRDYADTQSALLPRDGYESMGVGLYISRKLVERMGGEIDLDWTEPGMGTRMRFSLPAAKRMPDDLEVAASRERSNRIEPEAGPLDRLDGHEHTVLIVDDEASNILTLRQMLRRHKFNVVTAFSAEDAISKLHQYPNVDLAIVDVMMPRISGIELCRLIRERRSILDLPILISTVKDSARDIALGFRSGANDYVTKPFDGETLMARIQNLISMKISIQEAILSEQAFHHAQIKPHFLYNALSSIIGFCYTDGEKAASLLSVLSQYIRHILETDRRKSLVPLQRELEVIEAYVEIEKARFGERFDFLCEIGEGLMEFEVPSLSIQPFVENAIRHGLFEKDGPGTVRLSARIEENYVVVTIKDNGVGIPYDRMQKVAKGEPSESRGGHGIGIANIRKRLDGIPGAALTLQSERGSGTVVIIYLPYHS
ncbi:ATP-binding protein [Cohnella sp. GCM10020058]|uniref:hybrid sensor histidine kinase/response regulator n=1 Tax=Cohnella sp. GCM10020058 TaxID=3317330 RepID=UPI003637BDD1